MAYNNVNLPYYSEIVNTFEQPQDWISAYGHDLEQLVLWYRDTASQGSFEYDAAGPFDTFLDVGMPINSPDNLYLIVKDSAGGTAIINNPANPTAVQSSVWKQWSIDLQTIADQNVNLQAIKSLAIGIGDKSGSAAGGTGMLFIDDIGLHDTDTVGYHDKSGFTF